MLGRMRGFDRVLACICMRMAQRALGRRTGLGQGTLARACAAAAADKFTAILRTKALCPKRHHHRTPPPPIRKLYIHASADAYCVGLGLGSWTHVCVGRRLLRMWEQVCTSHYRVDRAFQEDDSDMSDSMSESP